MSSNPTINPAACAVVDVAFHDEAFSADNYPRAWNILKQTGGVLGDLIAFGNYPSLSQPEDEWSVSGNSGDFLTGPTVCAPLSAGTPPVTPFDGYVLVLVSETNGFPVPVKQTYRGNFTVPTSGSPPPTGDRPDAPTIAAVGLLVGNVPQINVSGM